MRLLVVVVPLWAQTQIELPRIGWMSDGTGLRKVVGVTGNLMVGERVLDEVRRAACDDELCLVQDPNGNVKAWPGGEPLADATILGPRVAATRDALWIWREGQWRRTPRLIQGELISAAAVPDGLVVVIRAQDEAIMVRLDERSGGVREERSLGDVREAHVWSDGSVFTDRQATRVEPMSDDWVCVRTPQGDWAVHRSGEKSLLPEVRE